MITTDLELFNEFCAACRRCNAAYAEWVKAEEVLDAASERYYARLNERAALREARAARETA